jgi:ArsR family transcriptional regulator
VVYSFFDEKRMTDISVSQPLSNSAVIDSQELSRPRPEHSLASIAKALAHPARIRIIETLLARRTCIGCDLVEEIGLAASTTSEHLRILKEAGLIIGEITRPRVCYSLAPAGTAPLLAFLARVDAAPATLEA